MPSGGGPTLCRGGRGGKGAMDGRACPCPPMLIPGLDIAEPSGGGPNPAEGGGGRGVNMLDMPEAGAAPGGADCA